MVEARVKTEAHEEVAPVGFLSRLLTSTRRVPFQNTTPLTLAPATKATKFLSSNILTYLQFLHSFKTKGLLL